MSSDRTRCWVTMLSPLSLPGNGPPGQAPFPTQASCFGWAGAETAWGDHPSPGCPLLGWDSSWASDRSRALLRALAGLHGAHRGAAPSAAGQPGPKAKRTFGLQASRAPQVVWERLPTLKSRFQLQVRTRAELRACASLGQALLQPRPAAAGACPGPEHCSLQPLLHAGAPEWDQI